MKTHWFQQIESQWEKYKQSPYGQLYALTLLRQLTHQVHAYRSRFSMENQQHEKKELNDLETRLEHLKYLEIQNSNTLEKNIIDESLKEIQRQPSEELLQILPEKELKRYDRKWEKEILILGLSMEWKLWTLTVQMQPESVESFHRDLSEKLWPYGIVLWVQASLEKMNTNQWEGNWWILVSPQIKEPFSFFSFLQKNHIHWTHVL